MRTTAVALATLLTACASTIAATQSQSSTSDELALAAAHREANRLAIKGRIDDGWPEHLRLVTAKEGDGTVSESNTGHPCDSGTIINVDLVGDFASVVGGYPGMTDGTVNEVLLKVDGESGQVCLLSVRTSPAPRDPDAEVLFER